MNYHILANLIHIFNTEKNSALYRNTLYMEQWEQWEQLVTHGTVGNTC